MSASTRPSGNPYRFTARQFDPETGLYYYRAGMYNLSVVSFIQPDPIGYAGGLNLYPDSFSTNPTKYSKLAVTVKDLDYGLNDASINAGLVFLKNRLRTETDNWSCRAWHFRVSVSA